ncbi:rhomboid family intramembrane serine protease [Desertibacillus haloalkaliphilus]|uniref:rhomboid family intramembrane serine protease n=1 Tax=Desertibacillus haloalkaliphilus TaxID=1328930 RepID=UPI001C2688EB|nr:rhomboid family intramembrane serine protease [Desertibacillus haloalkaliphilus]MBU8908770.1 rhomboid family intramembrane serine protease [Desertibacillus haloalkaliphilus]
MFIRNESFYTFRRNYPVITILVAIHLILFVWMNFLPFGSLVRNLGIGFNPLIAQGEYWRLVTPIFMHITLSHVLFNSFSLVLFGPALERMLGKFRFILIYITTGVIANIATFYIGGLNYPPHLGASGAIFGLFGIYVYMVLNRQDLIDQANSQVVMTILIIGLVMTFVNTNINIFAHLFGLIAGAALAPIILRKARPFYQYRHVFDDNEVSFDPNRWRKRRVNKQVVQKIIWISFAVLVLVGLLVRFM